MLYKVRYFKQVTCLCIDRTDNLFNECRSIILLTLFIRKVSPSGIYGKLFILTATVNCRIVHVHNVLTLLAIALYDECLHLFYSQIGGDDLRNAEECRLKNSVGAVAQAYFLTYLCSIDVVNMYVMLCEILLDMVWNEVDQFFTVEDCIEQECSVVTQTTCYVIHMQVGLNVASHKIRGVYLIS